MCVVSCGLVHCVLHGGNYTLCTTQCLWWFMWGIARLNRNICKCGAVHTTRSFLLKASPCASCILLWQRLSCDQSVLLECGVEATGLWPDKATGFMASSCCWIVASCCYRIVAAAKLWSVIAAKL